MHANAPNPPSSTHDRKPADEYVAGAAQVADDGPALNLNGFRLTPTALVPAGSAAAGDGPPLEDWAGPLRFALWCQAGAPWWIGDLLNAGDGRFGEMFSQVCNGAVSADQLQRYESVARRVPRENRRPGISWSAHAAVARLPHSLQRTMLDRAENFGWSSTVLLRKVRDEVARRRRSGQALDEATDDLPPEPDIEPYDT